LAASKPGKNADMIFSRLIRSVLLAISFYLASRLAERLLHSAKADPPGAPA
jgi:hypothetical protein